MAVSERVAKPISFGGSDNGIGAGIYAVFDVLGWVIAKRPWSLSFRWEYIDDQPWITAIDIAIFAGPVIGYFLA